MIASFRDRGTRRLFERELSVGFPQDIVRSALRKLAMLDAAVDLNDVRVPPSNHLEKLVGDRAGWYSIRVNGQWRICFRWIDGKAHDVELVDYH